MPQLENEGVGSSAAAGEGVSAIKHYFGRARGRERGRDDVCLLKRLTTADKKLAAHPSIRPSG